MEERIKKLIGELDKKREDILESYLRTLEEYDVYRASDNAGFLNGIDHHITNLHLELKRLEGLAYVK